MKYIEKILNNTLGYLIPHKKINLYIHNGLQSYTDGKSITLGLIPTSKKMTEEEEFIIRKAILGHEAQHILSSNFQYVEDIGNYSKSIGFPSNIAKYILNAVEDGRIEKILSSNYKGFRKYLYVLNYHIYENLKKENETFENVLTVILSLAKTGTLPKWYSNVKDKKLKEITEEISDLVIDGTNAITCKENYEICKKIINILYKHSIFNNNESNKSQSNKTNDDNQNNENNQSDSKHNQSDSKQSNSNNNSEQSDRNSDSEQSDRNSDSEQSNRNSDSEQSNSKYKEQLEKIAEQMNKNYTPDFETIPEKEILNERGSEQKTLKDFLKENGELDEEKLKEELEAIKKEQEKTKEKIEKEKKEEEKEKIKIVVEKLRLTDCVYEVPLPIYKKIKKEIVAKLFNKRVYNKKSKSGYLNNKDLWRFNLKEKEIFIQKGKPSEKDYVFYILQDASGSMCGGGFTHARRALTTLEAILKDLFPFKICTFNAFNFCSYHYIVKDFNENEKIYSQHLSTYIIGGRNADGYNIEYAVKELKKRTEKNKILIILSDGTPTARMKVDEDPIDKVKEEVEKAKKEGIQVISIFFSDHIMTNNERPKIEAQYKKMYGKNGIICDTKNLDKTLLRVLDKLLLKE